MANLAVFASGRGSNFAAIADAVRASTHRVVCLVTDKPSCPATERARSRGIEIVHADYTPDNREETERDLVTRLDTLGTDLIALAGFMRLLSPVLVDAFPRRIVNIHPALLPKYPGARAIEKSFRSGDTNAGITIHFVDYGMDTGPIITQTSFSRLSTEDRERFEKRIHSLEHETYPPTVLRLLDSCDSEPPVRSLR